MTVSETIQKSRELQQQTADARAALHGTRIMCAGKIRSTAARSTKRYLCEDCQTAEGSMSPWHDVVCECHDGMTITERPLLSLCDGCRTVKPVAVFRESTLCHECGSITEFDGRCAANCTKVGC